MSEEELQEAVFVATEEERLFNEIQSRATERVKVKVKPQIPLSELAAPLLTKWGK